MDKKPEIDQLQSILSFLDRRIQGLDQFVIEDNEYLQESCKETKFKMSEEYKAKLRYNIEYCNRAKAAANEIRAFVQKQLETINKT